MHKTIVEVKNDARVEVEYMTLLERDREKIEEGKIQGKIEGKIEGIELTKKIFKLNNKGLTIDEIAKACELTEEEVIKILE